VATEKLMQRVIMEEFQAHTVVAVLHRLEAAMEFDRIVIMQDGVVVADDSPEMVVQQNQLFRAIKR
jgi:ATP-binding cassette subfamily C (CFTR/MRP) protein 1